MTAQSMVTIAAPLATDRIGRALTLIKAMGNPAAAAVAGALDRLEGDGGVHFISLHAIAPTVPQSRQGHLVLEFSADGSVDQALAFLVSRVGGRLAEIFALSSDKPQTDLAVYLKSHLLVLGVGWKGRTGLAFAGTPAMSVGRIRREAALEARLAAELEAQLGGASAMDRLNRVKSAVGADPDFRWALEPPRPSKVFAPLTGFPLIQVLLWDFLKTFLWPLLIPFLVVVAFGVSSGLHSVVQLAHKHLSVTSGSWAAAQLIGALFYWAAIVVLVFDTPLLILAIALYVSLRIKENRDEPSTRAPGRTVLREMLTGENHYAQNHMVSVTRRKPGLTRRVTSRLAFWLIGVLAGSNFTPGFLGGIGTIHFARWVMLPGGRDFVFFSNFGGSWESYLEDFITKAHAGLTAVWSNTIGFPRSKNLFEDGATDGERFKRFARQSMVPTPFWYSAYPNLTTANIRTNSACRILLATAASENDATSWIARFSSAQRPANKLESNEIQSLLFGGLGFMPHGEVLLVDLGADQRRVRDWLKATLADVAFDDGRRLGRDAVVTLALGPNALAGAGLPADALESFPAAFVDGMTGPGRARILGDDAAPADQWWWGADKTHDAALLVYGISDPAVAALVAKLTASATAFDHTIVRSIPLRVVPDEVHEPFGFLDGVSQPVIRGTYQGLRNPDPINLVEAGEFILGYPDNRGNLPPGPELMASDDPSALLPIRCDGHAEFTSDVADTPREIGRNGSFLVIRQLEQDHDAFWAYCEAEAHRLRHRLPNPYKIDKEFIGAKMIGRWTNGSSLVRNPYQPFDPSPNALTHATRRPQSNPAGDAASIAPATSPADPRPIGSNPDLADNDFLFGAEDPQGLRCPYGAHIRRANPRDSLDPSSQDQIDISNRHRILRVGRAYQPTEGQKPGLMFMCLNGDIERQFEFVQQTWLGSETFHGLSGERDPIAGNSGECSAGFTIPTRDGPVRLSQLSRFVTPRGGGYFFVPGRTLLEFLSG